MTQVFIPVIPGLNGAPGGERGLWVNMEEGSRGG